MSYPSTPKASPLPRGEGQGEGSGARLAPKPFRRALRREATPAERKLWTLLRDRRFSQYKMRRQHTIRPYTADFYCHASKVVIEEAMSVPHLASLPEGEGTS
ncbi:MAG: hypothetical protein Rubg2KO_36440 [Rubricoccaceae bacterium]